MYRNPQARARAAFMATGGGLVTERLLPIDANSFWDIRQFGSGAIGHKFIRNSGGSSSTDRGSPWQGFMRTSALALATVASDPAAAASADYWTNDVGALGIAISYGGVLGGEYHGGATTTTDEVRGDGVTIDPTAAQTNKAITTYKAGTITWAGGVTADFTAATMPTATGITETWSLNSTATLVDIYVGMDLFTGDGTLVAFGNDALSFLAPAVADRLILGNYNTVQLRSPTTGKRIRSTSSLPTKMPTGYRTEIKRYATLNRTKTYYRATGTPSNVTGIVKDTTYSIGAAGGVTFTNLAADKSFAGGIGAWTAQSGSATATSGKMQMTRSSTENRYYTAMTGLEVGATYYAEATVDVAGTGAKFGIGINNGSYTNALIQRSMVVESGGSGINAEIFVATQTTHYFILSQDAGTAGQVINFGDVRLIKLAAPPA